MDTIRPGVCGILGGQDHQERRGLHVSRVDVVRQRLEMFRRTVYVALAS